MSLDHLCASSYAFTNLDNVGDFPARRSIADSSEPISVDFEGNKQGDTVKSDLGAAIQDSHSQVDIEVLVDANKMYEDSIVLLCKCEDERRFDRVLRVLVS